MQHRTMARRLAWAGGAALSLLVALACWARQATAPATVNAPVVVELFTSEGCSDCPPADALLARLAAHGSNNTPIIALGFHVDYWDAQGWRDRFSSHRNTERQENYAGIFSVPSIYTPQAVVDGRFETVGNNEAAVSRLVERAAHDPKPVEVALRRDMDNSISVTATSPPGSRQSGKVLLAVTEDDLTTEVKAGENRSRTLHHAAVVRWLQVVGNLRGGGLARTVSLTLDPAWQRDKLHAVAIVQHDNGQVIGAATVALK